MEFEELNRIPYSLEAERALIGGIFFDVNSLDEIKYIIKSDDFYKKEHAEIYKAIENLFSESRGVDPILVVEEIKKSDLKNEEEILQVLTEIIDENTSSYNLLEYAELIRNILCKTCGLTTQFLQNNFLYRGLYGQFFSENTKFKK